ncbi:S8 family serine peptidase [Streptomyces albidus (ex Kaewkla and Franco 2022)]|uniref:S8 family serine peptidase n=1 Tax=Streptomyces albidus (ex Kaewkla and Franco 2022) TaxID=722709 RepID=UPI0015EE8122|nr:S8 family serine peptidase [Streptomyces albidus (ex Kaewkla and Franco 2022)]
MKRWLLPLVAATGVWTVVLSGLPQAAVAEDVTSKQWYFDAMQMDRVWQKSTGKGVKVAVVDSGVSSTKSLKGQVLAGKNVSGEAGSEKKDGSGHGTTMAELIAGKGAGGLKGFAPDAQIIPIRTATSTSNDLQETSTIDQAIRAAADTDAKVINISISSEYFTPDDEAAVKYAASKGKLMFAAVGNEGDGKNKIQYPAFYRDVVGVGATDKKGKVSKFSQSGDYIDLVAPGSDIPRWCDKSFQRYCDGDGGTSASTAIASASAALIWSKHPDWTANQVLRVMIDTAGRESKSDKPSKYIGWGAVRPRMNLVEGEGDPGNPAVSPLTGKKTGPAKDTANSGSSDSEKDNASDKVKVADSSKSGDDGQLLTLIGAGVGVAVVLAGAFAFMRMRRNQR